MMVLWQRLRRYWLLLLVGGLLISLPGCDKISSLIKDNQDSFDSDKAVGASCRQTGRSLEQCFLRNRNSGKAAIYAGWMQMNEYMVKNKMPNMLPENNSLSEQILSGQPSSATAMERTDQQGQAISPKNVSRAAPARMAPKPTPATIANEQTQFLEIIQKLHEDNAREGKK